MIPAVCRRFHSSGVAAGLDDVGDVVVSAKLVVAYVNEACEKESSNGCQPGTIRVRDLKTGAWLGRPASMTSMVRHCADRD